MGTAPENHAPGQDALGLGACHPSQSRYLQQCKPYEAHEAPEGSCNIDKEQYTALSQHKHKVLHTDR